MCQHLFAIYYLLVLGWGTIESQHFARIADSAVEIQTGETEYEVLKSLGPPCGKYAAFEGFLLGIGARPAQWYYGSVFDLDRVVVSNAWIAGFPLVVNVRLFAYAKSDLIISWDKNQKVKSVEIPKLPIDERYDDLANWMTLARTIANRFLESGIP